MLGAAAIAGGVALVGLGTTAGAVTAPFPAGQTTFQTVSTTDFTAAGMAQKLVLNGEMTGTSDGAGNITFPAANVSIQQAPLTSPIGTVTVTTKATTPVTAHLNTTTGLVTLSGTLSQTLDFSKTTLFPHSTACLIAPLSETLSSAKPGGKPYAPTPAPATATVAGPVTIPKTAPAAAGTCPDAGTLNTAFPLPTTGNTVEQLKIFPPGVKPPATTTTSTTTSTVPVKVSSSTVTAGGQITISGNGWKAGSTVTLTLNSTPVALGTATVDASGAFTKTVTIPADTTAGTHTITVSGTDPAGAPRTVSVTITVSAAATTAAPAASTLPRTGSSSMPITLAGLALLVLGALLVLQGRRRVNAMR